MLFLDLGAVKTNRAGVRTFSRSGTSCLVECLQKCKRMMMISCDRQEKFALGETEEWKKTGNFLSAEWNVVGP